MTRNTRKGFTLIEILIVVIILGILAAIVIPQFTNASKDAKRSALVTMVQSLRSQVALYKLQHNDNLPGGVVDAMGTMSFSSDTFWNQMTQFSSLTGATSTTKDTTYTYGPYMQGRAKNPLRDSTIASVVIDGTEATAGTGAGFIYDFRTNGSGSGKIWGVDETNTVVVQ